MDSMTPIFNHCPSFKTNKTVPIQLLSILLSLSHGTPSQKTASQHLLKSLQKNNIRLSSQQFCSILFEQDIGSLEQLLLENMLFRYRWKIPEEFVTMARYATLQGKQWSDDVGFDLCLLVALVDTDLERDSEGFQSI